MVRRHAGGGVALDVLNGFEAFAQRKDDILRHHVVLEVDERAPGVRARSNGREHGNMLAARRAGAAEAGNLASRHE